MEIRTVGVVGCGLMGSGIAEVCARFGYQTIVREVDQDVLARGLGRIEQSMATAVSRGRLGEAERGAALERLRGVTELEALAECDLVIEAVSELLDAKQAVFKALMQPARLGPSSPATRRRSRSSTWPASRSARTGCSGCTS